MPQCFNAGIIKGRKILQWTKKKPLMALSYKVLYKGNILHNNAMRRRGKKWKKCKIFATKIKHYSRNEILLRHTFLSTYTHTQCDYQCQCQSDSQERRKMTGKIYSQYHCMREFCVYIYFFIFQFFRFPVA